MRILHVDIKGFGPLAGTGFDFVDGLNVIYGPNESAKTAIHAAIFAGLCGIRRGQGQPAREDKLFENRHKPWNGDPWQVSALIELADGRRVTLTHELAGKVGSTAIDESNGKDVSPEIISDGSIDGSVWLGLNRRSFRTTACIRQTEILAALADDADHAQDHRALQEALQKAATSAGQQDKSVGAALRALEDFWSENVGNKTHGNSRNRPYQSSQRRLSERGQALLDARDAHAGYLELLAARDAAIAEREARARAVRFAEAVVALEEAMTLEQRAARAAELQAKYPEQPIGVSGDEALTSKVSSALTLWETAPPEQSLAGETSEQLAARLKELPERPSGDLTPAQGVLNAATQLEVARSLHAHEIGQPELTPEPAPSPESLAAHGWARARIPMIAVGVFAIAGIAALALGAPAIGAVLLVAAVAAAAATFWFLRPASTDADARATVSPKPDFAAARGRRLEELSEQVATAERALADVLEQHGVSLLDGEPIEAAVSRYKAECSLREEQDQAARQRERLTLEHTQRQHAEDLQGSRNAAIKDLLAAAASVGVTEAEPDAAAAALREWQSQHQAELEGQDEATREWAELEQLLEHQPLEALAEAAQRARQVADETTVGFTEEELGTLAGNAAAARLPGLREQHQEALEEAARQTERAATEAKQLKSVAEAEAELDEAKDKFARVEELDETLETTIEFLKTAQERVYATIAPTLAKTLTEWLPRVVVAMNGSEPEPRYGDVQIDPETLQVEVCGRTGSPRYNADLLSAGTREQIYLLLRVALAERLVKESEVAPLLLDEVTAQADSTRRGALLELILELGRTRQIILFTHEDAVASWAQQRLEPDALQRLEPVGVTAPKSEPLPTTSQS